MALRLSLVKNSTPMSERFVSHILQHLIHVSLKISQMIFLILRLAYNVLKGINTGDMVREDTQKYSHSPLWFLYLSSKSW